MVAPAAAGMPWVLLLGVGGGVAVIVEQLQRMVGSTAASAVTLAQAETRAVSMAERSKSMTGNDVTGNKEGKEASQPARLPTIAVVEAPPAAQASMTQASMAQPAASAVTQVATITTTQAPLRIREEDVDPVMAVDLQFDCPLQSNVNPASVQRFGGYRRAVSLSPPETPPERKERGVVCSEAELEEAVQHAVEAALQESNVSLKLQVPAVLCSTD